MLQSDRCLIFKIQEKKMESIITVGSSTVILFVVFIFGMFAGFVRGVECEEKDREICKNSFSKKEVAMCFLRNIISR